MTDLLIFTREKLRTENKRRDYHKVLAYTPVLHISEAHRQTLGEANDCRNSYVNNACITP